jgi:hypothetical protein
MMKTRVAAAILLLVVLSLTGGCASKGKTVTGAKVAPADITVYESTDLLHTQYTLVQHVWVDSWRSNINIPSFGTEAEGVNAMKRVASDAGANALLHVLCVDGRTRPGAHASLYCYGDAIRVN